VLAIESRAGDAGPARAHARNQPSSLMHLSQNRGFRRPL
jgi:hypothetical protein